jgi:hypothetical protein
LVSQNQTQPFFKKKVETEVLEANKARNRRRFLPGSIGSEFWKSSAPNSTDFATEADSKNRFSFHRTGFWSTARRWEDGGNNKNKKKKSKRGELGCDGSPGDGESPWRDELLLGGPVLAVRVLHATAGHGLFLPRRTRLLAWPGLLW